MCLADVVEQKKTKIRTNNFKWHYTSYNFFFRLAPWNIKASPDDNIDEQCYFYPDAISKLILYIKCVDSLIPMKNKFLFESTIYILGGVRERERELQIEI